MTPSAVLSRCVGCGVAFATIEGPTHRYMESSPGCWQAYGEVLARAYSDRSFWPAHRLTADTYAVQHPGRPSRVTIQSVCVHLISLHLLLDRRARVLGSGHPDTLSLMVSFASMEVRRGRRPQALDLLRQAVEGGFGDAKSIVDDKAFAVLRGDPDFEGLFERVKANAGRAAAAH